MYTFLYIISTVLKVWMIIDAIQRRVNFIWYLIIFFVPFGEWIYFFIVKMHDFNAGSLRSEAFRKKKSINTLRLNLDRNPCVENKILLADRLIEENFFDEAIPLYKEVLQIDDENKDAMFGLGLSHFRMNDFETAAELFKKVIELFQMYKDYSPWIYLAECQKFLHKENESIEVLKELCKISPSIKHKVLLVKIFNDYGRKEEAKTVLIEINQDIDRASGYIKKTNREWIREAKILFESSRR